MSFFSSVKMLHSADSFIYITIFFRKYVLSLYILVFGFDGDQNIDTNVVFTILQHFFSFFSRSYELKPIEGALFVLLSSVHEHLELHFLTDWWTKMAATIRSENSRQHSKAHGFGEPKEVMKI